MDRLRVRKIGYALGAEVTGVDLRRELDDDTVAAIRQAWMDHQVLCFPGQELETKEAFVRFTGRFGEVAITGTPKHRDPENEYVVFITNQPVNGEPWDGHKQGLSWHSDQAFTISPNVGTFVLAKQVPDVGGDTLFANQYMAYETLSPTMRNLLDGLYAVHDNAKVAEREHQLNLANAKDPSAYTAGPKKSNNPPVVHEVVKTHPETGRRCLFLGDRVRQFAGWTEEESRPLLDFLLQHSTAYELTYRHTWRNNDLIMWDNRCLMHLALSDYDVHGDPRHLWRCSLNGPVTGRLYVPEEYAATPEPVAAGV